MPLKPPRPCNKPGCGRLTRERYCEQHKPAKQERYDDPNRESASARGYDRTWRKYRLSYLRANPVCEIRQKCNGDTAAEVDHIRPFNGKDDPLRLDTSNFQSACKACHSWKTQSIDRKARREASKPTSLRVVRT